MKLALIALSLMFVASGAYSAGTEKAAKKEEKKVTAKKKDEKAAKSAKRTDGLEITDLKVGSGMEAKLGSKITVYYKGTFANGDKKDKEFDSSLTGDGITFPLNEGQLIKGWTEGIPGMKVGGKRKLLVPYAMAYGERGTPDGTIPPKSDLNFEVELLKVE
jgi:FKBP-type peptidyl-prolyl cis-trans isomerase